MAITIPEPSKKLTRLLAVLIVIGFLLTLFGYFGPFAKASNKGFFSGKSISGGLKELNEKMIKDEGTPLKGYKALKFFAKTTFILMIVTIVWFVLLSVLYIDNPELVYLVIGGLAIIAAVITFIISFSVAKPIVETLAQEDGTMLTVTYGIGYGPVSLLLGALLFGGGTAGLAFSTPKAVPLHRIRLPDC